MAEDEPRFTEMLSGWVKEGEIPSFPRFTQEPEAKKRRRKRRYEREAAEVEKQAVEEEGQVNGV